jgi:hypothetical protein
VYAVNAGGPATSLNNVQYQADRFSNGGMTNSTTDPITGASPGTLYQTERYGTYKYEIPVTNSTYSIKMHFVELYHTTEGSRLFNVTVEGQPVVQNQDLFADVGHDTAYDVVVPTVMVADKFLTIELTGEIDNATISGFAIYSNAGGKFEEPPEPEFCDLPSSIRWTSTGAIIGPRNGDASVKDPSIVYYNNKYHVFATVWNTSGQGSYRSMYTSFTDFNQAASGTYQAFSPGGSSTVAPQVFYFRPQNRWYIFTQWPAKYTTSTNIENPSSWAAPTTLWPGNNDHGGALDYWVICDDANCYLYFFKDDGKMYYVKTTIANFPRFDVNQVKVANVPGTGGQSILFEAGNVYKIKGTNKYLLQVEGWGAAEGRRLYRSWTSTSLDGPWQAHLTTENAPFAGLNNTTFPGGQWTQQISHGEMIRDGYDEKMEIDACNMKFLYQGVNLSGFTGSYNARPYRLGLLTAQ